MLDPEQITKLPVVSIEVKKTAFRSVILHVTLRGSHHVMHYDVSLNQGQIMDFFDDWGEESVPSSISTYKVPLDTALEEFRSERADGSYSRD